MNVLFVSLLLPGCMDGLRLLQRKMLKEFPEMRADYSDVMVTHV